MEKHIEILVDRKEYITKEEAYQAINEQYHETGLDGYQDGIELMNRIAKIPAADVMEVQHGRQKEDTKITNRYVLKPQSDYEGLKRKYVVLKSDTGECIENCFILRPDKDPAAKTALMAYAAATKNEKLAEDIISWLSSIDGGQDNARNT